MVLTIDTNRTQITIVDTLLDLFIATPASYTKVDVQIFHNSSTTSTTKTYTSLAPIGATGDVVTIADVEYINPSFFTAVEFVQGVYYVVVTLTSSSQIQTSEGCLYVENGLKCQVDTLLLDETKTIQERVLEGLKYQSLVSSAECPCKCKDKIELYLNLVNTITNKCKTC
jgi:hypothetical protein